MFNLKKILLTTAGAFMLGAVSMSATVDNTSSENTTSNDTSYTFKKVDMSPSTYTTVEAGTYLLKSHANNVFMTGTYTGNNLTAVTKTITDDTVKLSSLTDECVFHITIRLSYMCVRPDIWDEQYGFIQPANGYITNATGAASNISIDHTLGIPIDSVRNNYYVLYDTSNKYFTGTSTLTDDCYFDLYRYGGTVTYDLNGHGGTAPDSETIYEGGKATEPTAPTATGYTFGGWYKESTCENAWDFDNDAVTCDTTLYAKWTADTYGITYYDKGGTTFSGSHESGYPTTHTYGTATSLKGATKTGYTFDGWFTTSDCSGTAVTSLGATDYTAAITLYAKWTANTYNITYLDKGGTNFSGTHVSGYPTTHTYDTATTLKGATKTGYTFGGWYKESDCSGTEVTSLGATDYTDDITLYAKWTADTYGITYKDKDGATFSGTHVTGYPTNHTFGTDTSLKGATKTGYTFDGWFTTSDCSGTAITSLAAEGYTADITLYAKWTVNSYTITTEASPTAGGTVNGGGTYEFGTSQTMSATANPGYTFKGWYDDETELSTDASFSYTLSKASDVTLTAKFTQDKYSVTIASSPTEGGSCSVSKGSELIYNEKITLTATANAGYTFEGFYDGDDLISTSSSYEYTVTSSKSLTAKFSQDKYSVTITSSPTAGGTSSVSKGSEIIYNEKITLTATANAGYTFEGFYDGDDLISTSSSYEYTVTSSKSLTAKFSQNKYTVKFVNYDGTELQKNTLTYNETPEYTGATPTKASTTQYTYTFSGWSPTITPVTSDATYTAQFTSATNKYTISFINDDGSTLQSGEVEYGKKPSYTGATPTKASTDKYTYTFTGWNPEIVDVTGNATYTAQYKATINKYTIKFVNDDGTELQSSEVEYGQTPSYTGATPTKASTAQYTYTFKRWDSEIGPVTGTKTYKAQYDSTVNKYTITFVDDDGTTVLQSSEVEYGQTPTYTNDIPTKPSKDVRKAYVFDGWDKQLEKVTGVATYKATYKTIDLYEVKFEMSGHGSQIKTLYINGTITKPTDPTADGYTFDGWYKDADFTVKWNFETDKVEGDITLYAKWSKKTNMIPIIIGCSVGGAAVIGASTFLIIRKKKGLGKH